MSFLYADNIRDTSGNITIPAYGSVINTSTMRYDGRPGYYARGWVAGDNASTLFALRLTASNVRHPNNILVASWQLSIETDNNTTFKVLKNGSWQDNRLGTSNSAAPSDEWYWKGLVCAYHDGDNSSTPSNYQLLYICRAGSTGDVNLDIVAQAADDGGRTVWINRTYGSAGQDAYEIGVCTGVVFEIAHESGLGLTD
jgi:hypothetical protein